MLVMRTKDCTHPREEANHKALPSVGLQSIGLLYTDPHWAAMMWQPPRSKNTSLVDHIGPKLKTTPAISYTCFLTSHLPGA